MRVAEIIGREGRMNQMAARNAALEADSSRGQIIGREGR